MHSFPGWWAARGTLLPDKLTTADFAHHRFLHPFITIRGSSLLWTFFFVLSFFFSIWEVARKEVNSYKSQIYVRLEPGSRNSMQILPRYHRTCSLPVCTSAGSRMRIDRAGQAAGTPPTQDTSIPSSTWMTAPWKLSVCVWRKGPFISMFYFLTGFSLYCESIVLNVSCKMRLTPSFKLHLPVL